MSQGREGPSYTDAWSGEGQGAMDREGACSEVLRQKKKKKKCFWKSNAEMLRRVRDNKRY